MVASSLLAALGHAANRAASAVVFFFLDFLEVVLCNFYMFVDYALEAQWKPCYCRVAREGTLEGVSRSMFSRSFVVSVLSKVTAVCTLVPTVLEMLGRKAGRESTSKAARRWSDCDCETCNLWSESPTAGSLFVRVQDNGGEGGAEEDVIFLHGFVSSSDFWAETVFPNFTDAERSNYRLLAVDLLGFGSSPKPKDSLYTIQEHVETIERSVLQRHEVGSFHIVAHSLGCILALALAVRHPEAVRSITLVAPPYFSDTSGGNRTKSAMRLLAPRRVWPVTTLGVSLACWYEHISRTFCLLVCRNHRLWESIFKLLTLNRIRTFMFKGFFCHTHNAAWHTLHNVLFCSGDKMDGYLDYLQERLGCDIALFHGQRDNLIPVDCSYAILSNFPRARVNVVEDADHITIILGRPKAFARELEEIWKYERERYKDKEGEKLSFQK